MSAIMLTDHQTKELAAVSSLVLQSRQGKSWYYIMIPPLGGQILFCSDGRKMENVHSGVWVWEKPYVMCIEALDRYLNTGG